MKINYLLKLLLTIMVFSACATQKLAEEGQKAYKSENYTAALQAWDQVIESNESKGQKAEPKAYFQAGIAALELSKTGKARQYLETAEDLKYDTAKLFASLAKIYKSVDNLSLEIQALENYHNKFSTAKKIDSVTLRLFETYVESENWQKAVKLWPEVQEYSQNNISLLTDYLIVNKNLENKDISDQLATQILALDPKNITALEWVALKHFWKAENLYVSQMKAYKKNRTHKQYNKLLKAWDQIWPDFKKARDNFLKLYDIDPQPRYAKYLWNIYKRMDKEKKAAYYRNKWKNS